MKINTINQNKKKIYSRRYTYLLIDLTIQITSDKQMYYIRHNRNEKFNNRHRCQRQSVIMILKHNKLIQCM